MTRSFLSYSFALAAATLVLLAAGATPASAQQPTSAAAAQQKYPEVVEGNKLLEKRDVAAAEKLFEIAARKYPELPSAHVMIYRYFSHPAINEPNAARLQLEKAIEADRNDPEPYIILGEIAWQDRRLTEAAMEFDKAKQLLAVYTNEKKKGTLESQMLSNIAQMAERCAQMAESRAEGQEDWKEAESRLRDYLKLDTARESLWGHQHLARALFQQGKVAEAYEILKKAEQIDRDNVKKRKPPKEEVLTAEAIMAQYFDQYGGPTSNPEYVKTWFDAALKKAPNDIPTRQAAATWALNKGNIAFAKEQAEAILKIEVDPMYRAKYRGSKVGRELRGLIALWEEDWSTAEKNFEPVLAQSPDDFVARNNMALALVEQEDRKKKEQALQYAAGQLSRQGLPKAAPRRFADRFVNLGLGLLPDPAARFGRDDHRLGR